MTCGTQGWSRGRTPGTLGGSTVAAPGAPHADPGDPLNPAGAGWLVAALLGLAVAALTLDRRQLLRARRRTRDPAAAAPLPDDARTRLGSVLGHLGLVLSDPFTPLAPDHRRLLRTAEQEARALADLLADPDQVTGAVPTPSGWSAQVGDRPR